MWAAMMEIFDNGTKVWRGCGFDMFLKQKDIR